MRYQFIQQEQQVDSPTLLCRVLQVSRSGYYAFLQRAKAPKPGTDELALVAAVQRIAHATHATYGSRRMMHELQAGGHAVGRYRTRTLMKKAQVTVIRRRRWTTTTQSRHAHPIAPNHLARQFTVAAPNQVWAGDITYLWTQTGWLYLAVVMDLFSRKVVGWALQATLASVLVEEALQMAVGRRQPPPGLLHHSDQGSQYAGHDYQALLQAHEFQCSMSRKGNCWDNAVVERFFGTLKREWTQARSFRTHQEAKAAVIEYIEMFYNSHRRHSTLGYLSPNEFEAQARNAEETRE
jgi:transposase InsO family protein